MADDITPGAKLEQPTPEPKPEPTGQTPVEPTPEPKPEPEPQKLTLDQIPKELVLEAVAKELNMEGITDPDVLKQYAADAQAALRREVEAAQEKKAAEDAARKVSFEEQLAEGILRDQEKDADAGKYNDRELSHRMLTRVIATLLGSTDRIVDARVTAGLTSRLNQEREADRVFRESPELLPFREDIEAAWKAGHDPMQVVQWHKQKAQAFINAGYKPPEAKPKLQAVQGGLSPSAYQTLIEPVGGQDNLDENYAEAARERAKKLQDEKLARMHKATEDY